MDDENHKKDDASVALFAAIRDIKPWKYPGSDIFHHHVLPVATLSPWLNDQEFMEIYQKIKSNTLVDVYRCHELWTLARQAMKIEGDILTITFDVSKKALADAQPSKSGKTRVVATTNGFSNYTTPHGQVAISLNATTK